MSGTILIAGGMAGQLTALRNTVARACYRPLFAGSGETTLSRARQQEPDLILICADLSDMTCTALCRRLRADPVTRVIPLVVMARNLSEGFVLHALEAGADDVFSMELNEAHLLARIRSLLRARAADAELSLRDLTGRELGFSEDLSPYQREAQICLISADPRKAREWQAALSSLCRHRIFVPPRTEAIFSAQEKPDVFVISADLANTGDGLRLMSNLRSRQSCRHAEMCIVLPEHGEDQAAMALDLGASDVVGVNCPPRELALRFDALVRRKLQGDRLRANLQHSLQQSVRDPLTGLHNRRYALPHLSRVSARAASSGRSFAVLVLDLDRFKSVNDGWGHAVGDRVLQQVAARLLDTLRSADLLARVGGEEFLAVLPDTGLREARAVADRLCRAIKERPIEISEGSAISVTVSIGLAIGNGRLPIDIILDQADQALRGAKSDGRNQVYVHENMTAA